MCTKRQSKTRGRRRPAAPLSIPGKLTPFFLILKSIKDSFSTHNCICQIFWHWVIYKNICDQVMNFEFSRQNCRIWGHKCIVCLDSKQAVTLMTQLKHVLFLGPTFLSKSILMLGKVELYFGHILGDHVCC